MRIHHLNCGTMCPPLRRLLHGTGKLTERGRLVCHCLLIESEHGLVLVDTGLGEADVADPPRLGRLFTLTAQPVLDPHETARAQLRRLGFSSDDVRHIVLTHLDPDHAGGIADFPNARVHVFEREHAAALALTTRKERQRYRGAQWAHGPQWDVHAVVGERWYGFACVQALAGARDEVLIVPLLGHSRGHAGVAVKTEHGWLLHAGDAYFAHDEVHATPPRCPPGLALFQAVVENDHGARITNQARLRELLAKHGGEVRVICSHDASELEALTRASRA